MSVAVQSTNDVHAEMVSFLQNAFPGAEFRPAVAFTEIWRSFSEKPYLSPWIAVAETPVWKLERATSADGGVHVRGTWRFHVDKHVDQITDIRRAISGLTLQLRPIGEMQILSICQEPDEALPFETVHRALLFCECRCNVDDSIESDATGKARLKGTSAKVTEIVMDYAGFGYSVEEMFHAHYQTIPLERIHAALTYYDNHRESINESLRETTARFENTDSLSGN